MPYIICVNQPGCLPESDPVAVATIEEARETAREELVSMERTTFAEAARATELGEDIRTLPEAGGTIGPLPDGYVIDVQRVEWSWLAVHVGQSGTGWAGNESTILDAYNNA